MDLGKKIKEARKRAGLTQDQLTEACGWDHQSRVSSYERNDREPSFDDLALIAKALGLGSAQNLLKEDSLDNVSPAEIRGWIPLISYVQAGEWSDAVDLYEPGYAEKVQPTAAPHSAATFALRVEGDSMTLPEGVQGRSFPHGMIIYIDPLRESRIGDFVVARHSADRRVTFKKLHSEEGRPVLMPLNPDRKQYPVIRDEFEIIGRVIDASWGGF